MTNHHANIFCSYYQAHVQRELVWFMVAILRSFEHLSFDRTLSKEHSVFEFYVPTGDEHVFLEIMHYFHQEGIVQQLNKLPNRLQDPLEQL